MYLTSEAKSSLFKKYGKSEKDTGTPEGQIALFTHRITHLTKHLGVRKKDYGTALTLNSLFVGSKKCQKHHNYQ